MTKIPGGAGTREDLPVGGQRQKTPLLFTPHREIINLVSSPLLEHRRPPTADCRVSSPLLLKYHRTVSSPLLRVSSPQRSLPTPEWLGRSLQVSISLWHPHRPLLVAGLQLFTGLSFFSVW
ncbi:uncharacterized protein DS421_4g117010 [Arachis hypogaea]|nr:uncharacterized protein DS421_4g117010 [Arachis hypogaea]